MCVPVNNTRPLFARNEGSDFASAFVDNRVPSNTSEAMPDAGIVEVGVFVVVDVRVAAPVDMGECLPFDTRIEIISYADLCASVSYIESDANYARCRSVLCDTLVQGSVDLSCSLLDDVAFHDHIVQRPP